jgi:hypothetical protein
LAWSAEPFLTYHRQDDRTSGMITGKSLKNALMGRKVILGPRCLLMYASEVVVP